MVRETIVWGHGIPGLVCEAVCSIEFVAILLVLAYLGETLVSSRNERANAVANNGGKSFVRQVKTS